MCHISSELTNMGGWGRQEQGRFVYILLSKNEELSEHEAPHLQISDLGCYPHVCIIIFFWDPVMVLQVKN